MAMTALLTAIADPDNWRLLPMYSEGQKRDVLVWVGDQRIILLAQEAVKGEENDKVVQATR